MVNDKNNRHNELEMIIDYVLTDYKTDNFVGAIGCSPTRAVRDFDAVAKVNHKTKGKKYEHMVLSLTPDRQETSDKVYMEVAERIAQKFKQFQCVYALHKDSNIRHLHFVANCVSYVDGRKFSQGPAELNRFKNDCNHILQSHGFDIIKSKPEDLRDISKYSFKDGFDFLEIAENVSQNNSIPIASSSISCYDDENINNNFGIMEGMIYFMNNLNNPSNFMPGLPTSPITVPQQPCIAQSTQYEQMPMFYPAPMPLINLDYGTDTVFNIKDASQFQDVMKELRRNKYIDEEKLVANCETDKHLLEQIPPGYSINICHRNQVIINFPDIDCKYSSQEIIDIDVNDD